MNFFTQMLPGLSTFSVIMLKLTAMLAAAWLVHFALARRNPRWRVLLWRVALAGALLLAPAELLLPRLHVPVGESAPIAVLIQESSSARSTVSGMPPAGGAPSAPVAMSAPSPAPRPAILDWLKSHALALLALVWGLGVLIHMLRLFSAHLRLRRVLGRAQPAPEWVRAMAGDVAEKMAYHGRFELCQLDAVCSPFAAGWRRPLVVLPAPMLAPDYSNALPAILAHELSHLRSRDQAWMVAARVVAACFWFHPLAWRLAAAHDGACEAVCDAAAAELSGGAQAYSSTLARAFLELVVDGPSPLGAPMLRASEITRRIRRLRRGLPAAALARRRVAGALCLGGAALLALGAIKLVQAEPAAKQPAGEPRTLRFPSDRSMGKLTLRDAALQGKWQEGWDWDHTIEARGEVKIPAGRSVALNIDEVAGQDLTPLDALDPNALQLLALESKFVLDQDLAHLKHLTGLKALSLQGCDLNGSGFEHLTPLGSLEELRLGNIKSPLTDDSMAHLGRLKSLRWLALWETGITDAGVAHLRPLTNLSFLALNNTLITDRGLEVIKGFSRLEKGLQLENTKITDRGLENLAGLSRLKHLKLGRNGITDAGLAKLKTLTALENLWINSDPVTDGAIDVLTGFKNLKELYAEGTKITDAGWARFKGMEKLDWMIVENLGDRGVEALSALPALRGLQIIDASITPASNKFFKTMKSLKNLSLSGDSIDADFVAQLQASLPGCEVKNPMPNTEREKMLNAPWRKRFNAVYNLSEGEVLKRIAPPFIPERMEFYRADNSGQAQSNPRGPDTMVFRAMPVVKRWGRRFGSLGTLDDALGFVLGLNRYEYEAPAELLKIVVPGDWIVRWPSTPEARLAALEKIMNSELKQPIHFEKRRVEREVIVARGRYAPHPITNYDHPGTIQIYVDKLDPDPHGEGGGSGPLREFLEWVGDREHCRVIDETESSNIPVSWRDNESSRFEFVNGDPAKLDLLWKNLSAQTELTFTKEKRLVDVWFISRR